MHTYVHRSHSLCVSVFSFYHMGPRAQTQVLKLDKQASFTCWAVSLAHAKDFLLALSSHSFLINNLMEVYIIHGNFVLGHLESLGQNNTKIIDCLCRNLRLVNIYLPINTYLFSVSIKLINQMSYIYYIQLAYY